MTVILKILFPASHKTLLIDDSGQELLPAFLWPTVGSYLLVSENLATGLISIFALAIMKLRTEFSALS